jgi:hypothetical protein
MFAAANLETDILTYPEMATTPEADKVWLATMIDAFALRAEAFTGRNFEYKARTRTFTCDIAQERIQLPAFNQHDGGGTVSAVYESSDQEFTSSNLLDSEDYYYEAVRGALWRKNNVWTAGQNTVQVTWTDGFRQPPADLRMACILQVIFWYQSKSRIGVNEVRFSQGGVAKTSSKWTLLTEVEEILEAYSLLCV